MGLIIRNDVLLYNSVYEGANGLLLILAKYFGNFDFELAVGPSGPTCGPTLPGVFEVPDPPAPAWCHAQIWPPEMVGFENCSKPGLWGLYGYISVS